MKPDTGAVRDVVDWDAVRARLADCRRAIEGDGQDDDATVLARRARALAALAPTARAASPAAAPLEVLVFRCGGECYAFETRYIAQVAPRQPLTRIAGLPNYVAGIVAIGGEVYSALDLRSLLALPVRRLVDQEALILLRGEHMEFGVLADEIVGIERHPEHTLEPTLPTLAGVDQTYLVGITPGRTAILDARRLLDDGALVVDAT
jgi:purine-binding chemotaxis protein CheW